MNSNHSRHFECKKLDDNSNWTTGHHCDVACYKQSNHSINQSIDKKEKNQERKPWADPNTTDRWSRLAAKSAGAAPISSGRSLLHRRHIFFFLSIFFSFLFECPKMVTWGFWNTLDTIVKIRLAFQSRVCCNIILSLRVDIGPVVQSV